MTKTMLSLELDTDELCRRQLSQGPGEPMPLPTEEEKRRGPVRSDDAHDFSNYGMTAVDILEYYTIPDDVDWPYNRKLLWRWAARRNEPDA